MRIQWTRNAARDVGRLYEFLKLVNPSAATKTAQLLLKAPHQLVENPRIGEQLEAFNPREVRRILVTRYEIRYEVRGVDIIILRIWHTRESR